MLNDARSPRRFGRWRFSFTPADLRPSRKPRETLGARSRLDDAGLRHAMIFLHREPACAYDGCHARKLEREPKVGKRGRRRERPDGSVRELLVRFSGDRRSLTYPKLGCNLWGQPADRYSERETQIANSGLTPGLGPRGDVAQRSRPRFQDKIEGSFGRTLEAREPALHCHVAQSSLAGLRAQRQADFLRARSRCADHR